MRAKWNGRLIVVTGGPVYDTKAEVVSTLLGKAVVGSDLLAWGPMLRAGGDEVQPLYSWLLCGMLLDLGDEEWSLMGPDLARKLYIDWRTLMVPGRALDCFHAYQKRFESKWSPL